MKTTKTVFHNDKNEIKLMGQKFIGTIVKVRKETAYVKGSWEDGTKETRPLPLNNLKEM
jgi:hypothetical protein